MKIDPTQNPSRIVNSETRDAGKTELTKQTEGAAQAESARFQASDLGDASKDIDVSRVNEIRQAISEGRLEMRTEQIADGILASARELAGGSV